MIRQIAIMLGGPLFSENPFPLAKGLLFESTSHYICYVKRNPVNTCGAGPGGTLDLAGRGGGPRQPHVGTARSAAAAEAGLYGSCLHVESSLAASG